MSVGELVQNTPKKPLSEVVSPADQSFSRAVDRDRQQNIYDFAPVIGADWLEASQGEPISPEEYQRLLEAHFATFSVEDIGGVFGSWDIYLADSGTEFAKRVKQKQADKDALLDQIYREYEDGLFPDELLCAVETYKEKNPNPEGKPLERAILMEDVPATPDVLIERYLTYKLALYFFEKYPKYDRSGITTVPPDENQLISMALGFNVENGKVSGSPLTHLKNSRKAIPDGAVEMAIDDLGYHDYFYPESRQNHLDTILEIGRGLKQPGTSIVTPDPEKPEYYFDKTSEKIIVVARLGRIAISELREDEGRRYLENLQKLGKLAVKAQNQKDNPDFIAIGLALSSDGEDQVNMKKRRRDTLDNWETWEEEDYISYGKWLLSCIGPSESLSQETIIRAYRLGLGPGRDNIKAFFGSITEYYLAIGAKTSRHSRLYDHWSREDYIAYGRELAREADPDSPQLDQTILLLGARARKGPGPRKISRTGYFETLQDYRDACGIDGPSPKEKPFSDWSFQEFIDYLIKVGEEINKRPSHNILTGRAQKNPEEPSPYYIGLKFACDPDKFGIVFELAGYVNTRAWEDEDHINWGVRFMMHNNGRVPTQRAMNRLARRYLGPSERPIYPRFGSFTHYRSLVKARYDQLALEGSIEEAPLQPRVVREFLERNPDINISYRSLSLESPINENRL